MNKKLQSMYKSGGLLKALLKDPAQRKMAEKMLGKAAKGMAVKSYKNGGPISIRMSDEDRKQRDQLEQRIVDEFFENRDVSVNNDGMGDNKFDEAVLRQIQNVDKGDLDYNTNRYYEEDGRGNKTPYIMSDNVTEIMGFPISYRKVPREAVEDYAKERMQAKQRAAMGIDDIPTYGMGGSPVKYRMGGPIKETDMDKIQKRSDDALRFEYRGEDYLQQNPEDIKDSGALLKYFTVSEAARMLEGDRISTKGSSPEEILMMARKKGFNPLTSARDLFDREIEIRKGRM